MEPVIDPVIVPVIDPVTDPAPAEVVPLVLFEAPVGAAAPDAAVAPAPTARLEY